MSPSEHEELENKWDNNSEVSSESWPRFNLTNIIDTEDFERYEVGGFHPVHLGDSYDDGRYRIVHKLGFGGFSTVWLARDENEQRWVALKIFVADISRSVISKSELSCHAASKCGSDAVFVVEQRRFTIDGPNGCHLCLVLPVLGPSTSQLSVGLDSRLTPMLSRRAGYEATKALANLHSQGLCHGDVTTANILFTLLDIDQYTESDMYRLFGAPETAPLETCSGEAPGPEAPRYIVKSLDFLSSQYSIIGKEMRLVDFDQSFPVSSPPEKMLGTPVEFLAPEVAAGLHASAASDVWALGCCFFRLRSGEGPFSGYEVTSPADLLRLIVHTLGDMPSSWGNLYFDYYGQPTKDVSKGDALWKFEGDRPLKDLVYKIWDQPENGVVNTGGVQTEHEAFREEDNQPYPHCFSDIAWKPKATKIDNVYLHGYDDDTDTLLEAMPKIPKEEAALLYDLLSKIFQYEPQKRPSSREILSHHWFHMDD